MSLIKIAILCCHYTNEATAEDFTGLPALIEVRRFPCSGLIEVVDILKALEEGADGVLVAVCETGKCHNRIGNLRAEKRVFAARQILEEIGLEPEILRLAKIPRLDTGALVEETKKTCEVLLDILSRKGEAS